MKKTYNNELEGWQLVICCRNHVLYKIKIKLGQGYILGSYWHHKILLFFAFMAYFDVSRVLRYLCSLEIQNYILFKSFGFERGTFVSGKKKNLSIVKYQLFVSAWINLLDFMGKRNGNCFLH